MNVSYFEWAVALLKSSLADIALWVESMVRACNCRNFEKVDLSEFQKVDFSVVPHLCVIAKRLLIVANSECCVSLLLLLCQSAEEHI